MPNKNVTMRRKIDNVIYDLMLSTTTSQIYDEATNQTLSVLLADMLINIGTKASIDELDDLKLKFNNLIKDAPEAYDTLLEISSYIATHQDEYTALLSLVSGKVDVEIGKGLSTNDFTNDLKSKLALLYTKEQIDTTFEEMNKKIDLIQSGGAIIDASNVTYENQSMDVSNVKEAIDKLDDTLNKIESSTYTPIDTSSGYLDLL